MIRLGLDDGRYSAPRPPRAEPRAITAEQFQSLGLMGPPVAAGVHVSQATANTVTAYWNGICVISGDLGVIDRALYRKTGEDDREKATDHPVHWLINEEPNPETTPMVFWETLVSHAVGWGNGYAEIEFDNASRPIGLWTITPDRMLPQVEYFTDRRGRKSSRVFYQYTRPDGSFVRLEKEDVFHLPGLGFDGIRGYSPVQLFRESLGLTLATERFGAAFFGNGAWPGVALQHPGELGDEALGRLRESMNNMHRGADRAHGLLVLEEGMTVSKPISIPPDDAQFLETRGLQIEETARILNLPPHKLKHKVNERPGGNFEASELDYQTTTLLPWGTRIEQECERKLLSPAMRGEYYVEHNYAKRLVTDTTTRVSSQKAYFEMGVLDADQIARQQNLPRPKPKKEPPAPEPPAPAPAPPPAAAAPPPEPAPAPAAAAARAAALSREQEKTLTAALRADALRRKREAQEGLLLAEIRRFMRREAENAKRASKKGARGFSEWLEAFYGPGEEGVLAGSAEPAVRLCMAIEGSTGDPAEVARGFARGYLARSKAALLELKARNLETTVPAVLKRWETSRALESLKELSGALGPAKEEDHVRD